MTKSATEPARTTGIQTVMLEVADVAAARAFYDAVGVGAEIDVREGAAPTSGFRGYTLSLVVSGPATVNGFVDRALTAGATALKPVAKSFWGYGGVVQAPDGSIWKVASSNKKDDGVDTRRFDSIVLLLGASDVAATKQFYVDHGLVVGKSFGKKYVEFASPDGTIKLALYGRRALAKDPGVPVDGSGSHRIAICSGAGSFSDPDGFVWEATQ